ncbi:hypothetical protein [Allobranchiibius sp. CTAmp26]|uniref:hypothetical protein n=1 Tax=Allobranchiibius sp. CTAmp26 TaxID=2815214 RepID=UPI001AA17477|nr:hypothetical protein [Allobranchiibius sp. CTAmp26]MBO1754961.1 hypothetical protein [Allobranchiibius sp. CTAmp26]
MRPIHSDFSPIEDRDHARMLGDLAYATAPQSAPRSTRSIWRSVREQLHGNEHATRAFMRQI